MGGVGAILSKNFNVWQHVLRKMQEWGGVSGQHQVRTLMPGNIFWKKCLRVCGCVFIIFDMNMLLKN